jgi:serine protease DegQ
VKYLSVIFMLVTSSIAQAAVLSGDLPVSLPPASVTTAQQEQFSDQFGPVANEQLLVVQTDPGPKPIAFSYADILEEPLRAVVRVESLVGPAVEGEQPVSIGSGVIISADSGYVVTNSHVVAPGARFRVRMADGRWRNAQLIGTDAATDLAVLKVDASGLNQVEIAETDSLRVGDIVFAVGYPLGLEQTTSIGIISGLSRSSGGSQLTDYIQTDAAINSGNSGGALLDANGRLVGINTAILSNSGGNMGIGFAIPAHMAVAIAGQLIDFGEVRHGRVGLVLGTVGESNSAMAGTSNWDGALVQSVDPGSPAEAAGIKPGDVITSFNGRHILSPQSLRTWIGVTRVGSTVEFEVWRKGQPLTFALKPVPLERPGATSLADLGASVRAIVPADGMPEGLDGVKVESVRKNSPAEHAGLLAGDVILSINNELVSNPQVCDRLVHEAAGRAGVVVYRSGMVRRIIIEGASR